MMENSFTFGLSLFVVAIALASCASLPRKAEPFAAELDHVYATPDQVKLTIDIYRPTAPSMAKRPAVLVLHGGGWRSRSGDMSSLCEDLAGQGYVALNATYRLAPDHIFPKAIDDAKTALAWVRAQAENLGIDPTRIYVWGYSAGGHLALLLGLDPAQKIKAIIAGGAPTDLAQFSSSSLAENFMGSEYAQDPGRWREASPVNHVQPNSPPVFLYHGEWDWIVSYDQMERMAERLRARHVEVETHSVSAQGHISVYFFSRESVAKAIDFLNRHP